MVHVRAREGKEAGRGILPNWHSICQRLGSWIGVGEAVLWLGVRITWMGVDLGPRLIHTRS